MLDGGFKRAARSQNSRGLQPNDEPVRTCGPPAPFSRRISKGSNRRVDPQPRGAVPAQARTLLGGARQTIGDTDQESILARFGGNHIDSLSSKLPPWKALRGHAKGCARIIKI